MTPAHQMAPFGHRGHGLFSGHRRGQEVKFKGASARVLRGLHDHRVAEGAHLHQLLDVRAGVKLVGQ